MSEATLINGSNHQLLPSLAKLNRLSFRTGDLIGVNTKGERQDLSLLGISKSSKRRLLKEAQFICFAIGRNGLKFKQRQNWRDVAPKVGQIRGLPQSRGRLVATDGIRCIIERTNQSAFVGHLASFVADKQTSAKTARGVQIPADLIV